MGVKQSNRIKIPSQTQKLIGAMRNLHMDIPAVVNLNNEAMKSRDPEKGFIIMPMDNYGLTYLLAMGLSHIVEHRENGLVVGFVMYDTIEDFHQENIVELRKLLLERPDLKSRNGIFIEKIVVAPEFQGRGIATRMIERAVAENPGIDFIASSIIFRPVFNRRSLNFHEGLGFERVGNVLEEGEGYLTLDSSDDYKLPEEGIESIVLLKEL